MGGLSANGAGSLGASSPEAAGGTSTPVPSPSLPTSSGTGFGNDPLGEFGSLGGAPTGGAFGGLPGGGLDGGLGGGLGDGMPDPLGLFGGGQSVQPTIEPPPPVPITTAPPPLPTGGSTGSQAQPAPLPSVGSAGVAGPPPGLTSPATSSPGRVTVLPDAPVSRAPRTRGGDFTRLGKRDDIAQQVRTVRQLRDQSAGKTAPAQTAASRPSASALAPIPTPRRGPQTTPRPAFTADQWRAIEGEAAAILKRGDPGDYMRFARDALQTDFPKARSELEAVRDVIARTDKTQATRFDRDLQQAFQEFDPVWGTRLKDLPDELPSTDHLADGNIKDHLQERSDDVKGTGITTDSGHSTNVEGQADDASGTPKPLRPKDASRMASTKAFVQSLDSWPEFAGGRERANRAIDESVLELVRLTGQIDAGADRIAELEAVADQSLVAEELGKARALMADRVARLEDAADRAETARQSLSDHLMTPEMEADPNFSRMGIETNPVKEPFKLGLEVASVLAGPAIGGAGRGLIAATGRTATLAGVVDTATDVHRSAILEAFKGARVDVTKPGALRAFAAANPGLMRDAFAKATLTVLTKQGAAKGASRLAKIFAKKFDLPNLEHWTAEKAMEAGLEKFGDVLIGERS